MPVVNVKKLKYKNTDFHVFKDDKLLVHTDDQGKRLQLIIFVDFCYLCFFLAEGNILQRDVKFSKNICVQYKLMTDEEFDMELEKTKNYLREDEVDDVSSYYGYNIQILVESQSWKKVLYSVLSRMQVGII